MRLEVTLICCVLTFAGCKSEDPATNEPTSQTEQVVSSETSKPVVAPVNISDAFTTVTYFENIVADEQPLPDARPYIEQIQQALDASKDNASPETAAEIAKIESSLDSLNKAIDQNDRGAFNAEMQKLRDEILVPLKSQ